MVSDKSNNQRVILYVFIGVLILFGVSAYYYNESYQKDDDRDIVEINEQTRCVVEGGEWREFPNGCADSCALERNPEVVVCAQAFTYGCDCEEDMCWNGESCEAN